jgi:WD40 repeat protein
VVIYDTVLNQPTQVFEMTGEVAGLAWSNSNRYLAARFRVADGHDLKIWDLQTRTEQLVDHLPDTLCDNNVYWANTRDVIASPYNSAITIWDPAQQQEIQLLRVWDTEGNWELESECLVGMSWSRDDQFIYAGFETYYDNIVRWEIATGRGEGLIDHEALFVTAFALHPDNLRAAVSDTDGFVTVYNLETKAVEASFSTRMSEEWRIFRDLIWQGNSNTLLGFDYFGGMFQWVVDENRLINTLAIRQEQVASVRDVALSPFGGRLAVAWTNNYRTYPYDALPYSGFKQVLAEGSVDVITPAPSFELLNDIQTLCLPESTALTAPSDDDGLRDYLETVESLSDDQIPPGCKADLLAVVETLQTRE